MIPTKPIVVTRLDKAELWHQPGFEPRERESVIPLLVVGGFLVVVGIVGILRRIL